MLGRGGMVRAGAGWVGKGQDSVDKDGGSARRLARAIKSPWYLVGSADF